MTEKVSAKVALTGIKPTGRPHLGNYVGMLKPALSMVGEHPDYTFLYFIADYHALTTLRDPERFRELVHDVAATWVALGLDPQEVILYRQSDIPEVFELTWLLSCVTPKGLMNRAHAYKAAVAENVARGAEDPDAGVNMGLYNYPVLMSADILLFETDVVPVGRDQIQHVEIARDVAGSFNAAFGDVLTLPRHVVREVGSEVPGLDGRKMSASYDNTIPLFTSPEELRDLVFSIRTDSSPADAPKDPAASPLFQLYQEFAGKEETEQMRERYLAGIGWKEAKEELFGALNAVLKEPRRRYRELMADPAQIEEILEAGALKARALAGPLMEKVRRAVGAN